MTGADAVVGMRTHKLAGSLLATASTCIASVNDERSLATAKIVTATAKQKLRQDAGAPKGGFKAVRRSEIHKHCRKAWAFRLARQLNGDTDASIIGLHTGGASC